MALLWADGFEHYGTGAGALTNMLAGPYGVANVSLSSTQARTGSYSMRTSQGTGSRSYARRVLPGAGRTEVGFSFGLFLETLPPDNTNSTNNPHGVIFRDASGSLISFGYRTDGSIEVFLGGMTATDPGVSVGSSDPGVIGASAFHHVEVAALIDSIVGWVEVRVDNVVVFQATDLDTGDSNITNIEWGASSSANFTLVGYYDDVIAWDSTGALNNTFLGPQRVYTLWAETDEATQDWTLVGAATGHDAISEVPPDGDDTYIAGLNVDDVSEFGLGEMPPETALIAGVYIPTMAKLSDAGVGNIQVSLVSGGEASDGPDQPLTTEYTYWGSMHQTDPNTDSPWTKSSLEAAILRVKKTA